LLIYGDVAAGLLGNRRKRGMLCPFVSGRISNLRCL
jgi:hypothetical protein